MALPVRVTRGGQSPGPFDLAQREFENLMSRFLGLREGEGTFSGYGVDIREDADHIYVEAEMPGFRKEDIDISLENQVLTISAETTEKSKEQKDEDYLLRERSSRRYTRSFTLPVTIDQQQVNAKLQDGVLTITLNKREEAKPKHIPVS